ncbi:MAG: CotH kinase family protein [Leadbetterella sp.]|nr:CotH kinase family protein [Leadbetterella sp.]MBP8156178.1 CotH kinase family protein [Leadbetterella sp.]
MRTPFYIVILLMFLFSCEKSIDPNVQKAFGSSPDYTWVFPEEEIRTISINIGAENWEKIQRDMEMRIARKFGSTTAIPGVTPMQVTNLDAVPGDPIYVSTEVKQGENTWKKVGFRLKGNASLSSSWRSGIYKLPFKLQFDEFEDEHKEVKNQRFYGFRELSFSPSFGDNTFMKEKLLTSLFRGNGVLACKVANYKVYLDFGQGSKYCGVYQLIEAVAEHLVENQTGKQAGNVYKPESNFQNLNLTLFEKQNNKQQADYEDVKRLITVLNSGTRQSDKIQWKKDLEAIFDVERFLKYLAVNNTVGNWDGYGQITHNYFLANIDGRLSYLPYDLNLSFQMKGGNNRTALSFDMNEVTSQWPLIRYLIDDSEYFSFYKSSVKEFIINHFNPTLMKEYLEKHKTILQPNFVEPNLEKPPYSHLSNAQSFTQSVMNLEKYINERHTAASIFVKE